MKINHLRWAALCVALGFGLTAAQGLAATATVAGLTFDIDNSITEATLTIDGSLSPSFFAANVNGNGTPIDDADHVGALLPGGVPSDAIDLTGGTNGSTGRARVVVGWGAGNGVQNLPGDDFHIFESAGGNTPTEMFVEPFGVAVREANGGSFSGHRYEHIDLGDLGPLKSRTSYDLSDFGIASGAYIDAVEIVSLHNASATTNPNLEDRVDDASGEGNLSLDAGNGSGFALLRGPNADQTGTPFPDSSMDADVVYVVAENVQVVPAPSISFCDDFNTDTSADYEILAQDLFNTTPGTEDYSIDWAYDYSLFTFADTDNTDVPVAPRTTDASRVGVRLAVNLVDETNPEGVGLALVPAPSGSRLDFPAGTPYRLIVDMFIGYNGDALGGGGSTEAGMAGGNLQGNQLIWGGADGATAAAPGSGFAVAQTGEAGAANDYAVYLGDGSVIESTDGDGTLTPADAGYTDTTTNAPGAVYQALFPQIGVSDTAGAGGKRWVTLTLTVTGTNAVWSEVSPRDGTSATLANIPITALGVPQGGAPFIGMQDLFDSVAASGLVGDIENWVIFDNLCVEEIVTTSVGDYSLYL